MSKKPSKMRPTNENISTLLFRVGMTDWHMQGYEDACREIVPFGRTMHVFDVFDAVENEDRGKVRVLEKWLEMISEEDSPFINDNARRVRKVEQDMLKSVLSSLQGTDVEEEEDLVEELSSLLDNDNDVDEDELMSFFDD